MNALYTVREGYWQFQRIKLDICKVDSIDVRVAAWHQVECRVIDLLGRRVKYSLSYVDLGIWFSSMPYLNGNYMGDLVLEP